MIIFENEDKLFTELAQSYIKTFIIILDDLNENYQNKLEAIEKFFPKLVYLENKDKCWTTFLKICEWASDNFFHKVGALEKYVIIMLLMDIDEEINVLGSDKFCSLYFKKTKKEIVDLLKNYMNDTMSKFEQIENKTIKDIFSYYITAENIIETLFDDSDELYIDLFIGKEDESLELVDEYNYDILPNDIVKRIKKAKELSNYSVEYFLFSFKEIIEKSFFRIHGFNQYLEKDFQLLFELYARAFNAVSLEFNKVYKEVDLGNGKVDFILSFPNIGEVLFEIKMNRKDNVIQSILYQIPEYLSRLKKDKAFLIIFSAEENNYEFLEVCEKIYKEKRVSIYPYIISIIGSNNPSKIK